MHDATNESRVQAEPRRRIHRPAYKAETAMWRGIAEGLAILALVAILCAGWAIHGLIVARYAAVDNVTEIIPTKAGK